MPFAAARSRGVIAITGPEARAWLDNLVTNDLTPLADGQAVFAALLSPQGKVLFEFFVIPAPDGLWLDTHASAVAALIKRLGLYRLRAQITLSDASAQWCSVWAPHAAMAEPPRLAGAVTFADPRAPHAMWRGLLPLDPDVAIPAPADDDAVRVAFVVPQAPDDYALGDVFPHEANYDLQHGVSFTKGCFIGQEVVSRMQNKAVVRKRVVGVAANDAAPFGADLVHGADITVGRAVIGKVGTIAGRRALALLRLDRAAEATDAGQPIMAGAVAVSVEPSALQGYRLAVINRPVHDL